MGGWKMWAAGLVATLAVLPAARAQDAETLPLEGSVMVGDLLDLGVAEQAGTQGMSLYLQGAAAQWFYEHMPEKPSRNECIGGWSKFGVNGVHCAAYDDDTFSCDFVIDPVAQTISGAFVC